MKRSRVSQKLLLQRVEQWAIRIKVRPRVVRVQKMSRKWGSCSTSGTITLAADLMEQDERFQDFVIAHELLHLRVPNHGRLFKALMSVYVPKWAKLAADRRAGRDVSEIREASAPRRGR